MHIFPLACKEGKKKRKDICALTPIGNTPKLSRTTEMHVSLFLVNMYKRNKQREKVMQGTRASII